MCSGGLLDFQCHFVHLNKEILKILLGSVTVKKTYFFGWIQRVANRFSAWVVWFPITDHVILSKLLFVRRKTIHSQTFPKGLAVFPRKFICEWNRSLCGEQRLKMNFYICGFLIWTQIISGVRSLLDKWPSLELREAAAQFLGKCGSKDIPEHLEVRS